MLKGHFSLELQQALIEILLNNRSLSLWLISDQPLLFPLLSQYNHEVSAFEKQQALGAGQAYDTNLSLSQLRAIHRHQHLYPNQEISEAWQGLEKITHKPQPTGALIDLSKAREISQAFDLQRLTSVQNVLNISPFVFLSGMSGVGKTSFIKKIWSQHTASMHLGGEQMLAWAEDKTPGIKTLFIDEANITARNWSEFEGLFNTPPGIMIANKYFELTAEHKVIFAGNPVNYGGERQLPSLIKRHGNSLLFHPMPPEYLYQEILQPILADLPRDAVYPILEIASYLSNCSQDTVLISPRELTSMALFTKAYCLRYPTANAKEVSLHYAYMLGFDLTPEAFKKNFKERFSPQSTLLNVPQDLSTDFIMTPSHRQARAALDDFLNLRHLQQNSNDPVFRNYKGLGGLIVEGEPGHGKTRLVQEALNDWGLSKGNIQVDNTGKKIYYDLPASMSLAEKRQLLLKAFHEGAVVVIDEINCSPSMERLMNDLLMGHTPEGQTANNQGFLLIATQNPPSMAGRAKASTAQERRMQKISISNYTKLQLTDMLKAKEVPGDLINELIEQHMAQVEQTRKDANSPQICPRNLFKNAEKQIKARASMQNLNEAEVGEEPKPCANLLSHVGLYKRPREICANEFMSEVKKIKLN